MSGHRATWLLSVCVLGIGACSDEPGAPQAEGDSTELAALEQRIDAAAALTDRLRAVRAVKRLQHAYGHYSEVGLWHDFADLFADTAVGHYTQGDLGKEEIRKLFIEQVGQGILGLADGRIYPHIALSPVITLAADGKSAKARWRIVAMLGGYGGSASFARGVYENAYVEEDGVWKVQEISFFNQVGGRYGESLRPTVSGPLDAPSSAFHYEPGEVGTLATSGAARASSSETSASFDALVALLGALEPEVAQLTAENAVLNLQNAYGYYVDRKLWDDVADLFADGGTMEIGQSGVYEGRESIRRGLEQFGPAGLRDGEINDYILMQPIVTVASDGATAKARGVYLGMTGTAGVGAQWREGIYENEFARDGGVWKIKALHDYPRLVTDYDLGWAADAQPHEPTERIVSARSAAHLRVRKLPEVHDPAAAFPSSGHGPAAAIPGSARRRRSERGRGAFAAGGSRATAAELDARLAALEQALDAAAAAATAENLAERIRLLRRRAPLGLRRAAVRRRRVGRSARRRRVRRTRAAARRTAGRVRRPTRRRVRAPPDRAARHSCGAARGDAHPRASRANRCGRGWRRPLVGRRVRSGRHRGERRVADRRSRLRADLGRKSQPRLGARSRRRAATSAAPSASDLLPPDRPLSGPAAPPFPAIADVPFHYSNPVSGCHRRGSDFLTN